jgi:chemotaxis protein MotB
MKQALSSVLLLALACGPSSTETAARNQLAETNLQLEREREQRAALDAELEALQERNRRLTQILDGLGEGVVGLERDQQRTLRRLDEAQQAIEELEQARAESEGARQMSEEERAALEARLREARRSLDEIRAREAAARARLATFRNLLEKFQAMIESGFLRVRIVRNRMVVELPEAVLFDSGRAVIKDDGQDVLKQVAAVLPSVEDRDFQIAGHTDNVPINTRRFPSNWELSTARAVNVARFLIEHEVPQQRLSAAGYADTQPVASNETDEGRQQNRRIEIVLMPNLDELPDLSVLEDDGD